MLLKIKFCKKMIEPIKPQRNIIGINYKKKRFRNFHNVPIFFEIPIFRFNNYLNYQYSIPMLTAQNSYTRPSTLFGINFWGILWHSF